MTPLPISLTQINPDEVLRYMGTPPDQAGADLRALAETCAREVLSAARPRWAWRALGLTFEGDGVRLEGGLLLPGNDLREHLAGCDRAAVFCATLGAEVDGLVRRWERLDMGRALALDCCASAGVEELCDQIADRSTASRGDVQVVVDGLLYILKQRLQKGETVQLGDLGHFQAVIGSKGTKLEADFNASLIKRPRIVFRPSVTLKSVTGLAKFEKIVPDAPAPGGGDSESPDEI